MFPSFLRKRGRRVRSYTAHARGPLLWAALGLASCLQPAIAARPVRVYEVAVPNGEAAAMLQQAMRAVLVRATGRRDAAADPAYAGLVQDAQRYLRSERPLPDARTQVVFDGAAIEHEILAGGHSVWDSERPFTLVVLSPPLSGPAADSARRSLEEVAEQRGLPIGLVPIPLVDGAGHELGSDLLLQSARGLGADDLLIGKADPGASGVWQWTLLSGLAPESWSGGFDAGINGAADALARVQVSSGPVAEAEALVQVNGVTTLADYAALERLLGELPGARNASIEQASGATVLFRVLIRGGADALSRALASAPHLTSAGAANARLTYDYHP